MSKELAAVLSEARKRLGLTQKQVADGVGVSRPAVGQWESGEKDPSTGNLIRVCTLLKIHWQEAVNGILKEDNDLHVFRELGYIIEHGHLGGFPVAGSVREEDDMPHALASNVRLAPDAPTEVLEAQSYLPLDVPVLGVSMGGDNFDFQFNGETVDYYRRPIGIAKAKRAYATFVVGESMVPAYKEGAVVFVNPDKLPSIGDDVVIELHSVDGDGQAGPGYLKRLKKRTPTKVTVEQFNPPADIEFQMSEVKAMHRVVPWNELLGI